MLSLTLSTSLEAHRGRHPRLAPLRYLTVTACAAVLLATAACGGRQGVRPPSVVPSTRGFTFTATAYCTGRLTASGTVPTPRDVAADPEVLPLGTRIRLAGLDTPLNGIYTVRDTGGSIKGRRIDIYMRSCRDARDFGRRRVRVDVIAPP